MTTQSIRRTALIACAAVAAGAAVLPATAQAQQYGSSYDQRGQYYYDGCRRDTNGRTAVGAILGGLAGMALGNNVGSDRSYDRRGRVHDNDTNATVGAIAGALAGGAIGRNSAACQPEPKPYQQSYSYTQDYYATPQYSAPQRNDYYYDRYQSERGYAAPSYDYGYGNQGYGAQGYGAQGYGAQGCRMVESRIRLPDGRSQTRMVQACPDSQGRYQIVD